MEKFLVLNDIVIALEYLVKAVPDGEGTLLIVKDPINDYKLSKERSETPFNVTAAAISNIGKAYVV